LECFPLQQQKMAAQLQHFTYLSPSAFGGWSERSEDNPHYNPLLECFPLQQQKMAAQLQHFTYLSLPLWRKVRAKRGQSPHQSHIQHIRATAMKNVRYALADRNM
ncbi:MAG: hypothetical protein ACK5PO_00770, partial [Bacteroidota bacterium]